MDSAPSLSDQKKDMKSKSSTSYANPNISSRRVKFTILGVMISAMAVTLPTIILQDQEMQLRYRDMSIAVLSTIATGSAIATTIKMNDPRRKMIFSIFAVGLGLWSAAEALWAYYVFILDVEVPYPSIADVLYLAAYPFIGYFLYRGNKMIGEKENEEDKLIATALTITV